MCRPGVLDSYSTYEVLFRWHQRQWPCDLDLDFVVNDTSFFLLRWLGEIVVNKHILCIQYGLWFKITRVQFWKCSFTQ